jgi:acetolactate synthase-1/2/3 large subunit
MNEVGMKVSDYIVWKLSQYGIHHVFMLPGGGCMYLVDALARQSDIKVVTLLHEQSVGIAAEAYAQFTGKAGVSLVTTGPGGTNAIAAWTDSTPTLFISGQVKTSDNGSKFGMRQLGFQELPITEIVRPITKKSILIESADSVPRIFDDMLSLANSGRPGPVWLDIPLDIQNQEIAAYDSLMETIPTKPVKLSEEVADLISAIGKSKKPLFLIGNGIRLCGGLTQMEELIDLSQIPALLTWKMIDFLDEKNNLNAGRPGAIAQPWSNLIQEESDLIICLGARIDTGQSSYNLSNFGQKAIKYIIDIDMLELNKFPANKSFKTLNYDLADFLPELFIQLSRYKNIESNFNHSIWLKEINVLKNNLGDVFESKKSKTNSVNVYSLISNLSELLDTTSIIVPGSSGACSEVMMQSFRIKKGQRVFNSEGLGPMGFAIPAALGACIASGGRRIISIDGDGGFLMNLQELASVKMHADNIIFFVLNNNGYGSIKLTQDKLFSGRRFGTDPSNGLALVNLREIARAFEFTYEILRNEYTLVDDLRRILAKKSSVIVEVIVDPDQITLPRVKTIRDDKGNPLPSDMKVMDY